VFPGPEYASSLPGLMNALEHQPPIEPHDWNFDPVPDDQLIACCYWEYARESTFLREFKSRCVETNRNPKPLSEAFELCGKDARRILSIGAVANSFLLGFGYSPDAPPPSPPRSGRGIKGEVSLCTPHSDVTGNFPAAWQSLSPAEREYRAQLAARATLSPLLGERVRVRGNSRPNPTSPPAPKPFQRASGADAVNALLFLT